MWSEEGPHNDCAAPPPARGTDGRGTGSADDPVDFRSQVGGQLGGGLGAVPQGIQAGGNRLHNFGFIGMRRPGTALAPEKHLGEDIVDRVAVAPFAFVVLVPVLLHQGLADG